MTIQFAAAVLAISGLTTGSLPNVFFINPAYMGRASHFAETGRSLPDVALVNSAGTRIAKATIHVAGRQCYVRLRGTNLAAGNYRARLAHSARCFGTGKPDAGEMVDSASFAVGQNKNMTPAGLLFITAGPADQIADLIANDGLIIQIVDLNGPEPVACGELSRSE